MVLIPNLSLIMETSDFMSPRLFGVSKMAARKELMRVGPRLMKRIQTQRKK